MASPFTIVGYAAREELLSSDVIRTEKLWSRALQEEMRLASLDDAASPIDAFTRLPSFTPVGGGFTADVGAGEALVGSSSGVTADDSPYQVLAWAATQTLTFSTPDPVNPRIDLVVAPLATVAADVSVRNILVDPVNRTIVPTPVPKTVGPSATLAVVAGTASGTPVPPAVPADNFALFEVYVPAAAADATAFRAIRRMQLRSPYPFSRQDGVVMGVDLRWTQVNPGSASAVLTLGLSVRRHKVLIDGELLDFTGNATVFPDLGGNNPFGSAAPATTDKPYYIYLVGGRHAPQASFTAAGSQFTPVALVESTVAPDFSTGKPQAAIRNPRTGGTTVLGALYVGLGWVFRNTTNRRTVMVSGNWAFAAGGSFESAAAQTIGADPFSYPTLASAPTGGSSAGSIAGLIAEVRGTGTGVKTVWISPTAAAAESGFLVTNGYPFSFINGGRSDQAQLWYAPEVGAIFTVRGTTSGETLTIIPMAYQINAIRLDGGAFGG